MHVYIIMTGYYYESSSVLGVYTDEALAIQAWEGYTKEGAGDWLHLNCYQGQGELTYYKRLRGQK